MATATQIPELVSQKLAAFARIQSEFEECFRFKQAVHGQKRFPSFSVAEVVHYLHALWLCECKDLLLSIYKNIRRYEGRYCLEVLRTWQQGRNTEVVAFLVKTIDALPFADITSQLEDARDDRQDKILVRRLEYGRLIMLNRGMNLMHALEAIFSLAEVDLLAEIRSACEQYGHTPAQIDAQLAEMETPLYTYRPHPLLAQQNMVVMNKLDVDVVTQQNDHSGEHFWHFTPSTISPVPFAEQVISGYLQLRAPVYNNRRGVRFVDRVELDRDVSV